MAYRKIEDSKLTSIANSIRAKLGATVTMKPDEMPKLIEDIGIGYIPDYWRSYLSSKATEINTALTTASENKSAFLWYTDAHWKDNFGQSPMILKYLSKNTGMQKTFFGGDVAQASSGEIPMLTAWKELVKDIPNHHSVIGNHDNQVLELATAEARGDFFINRTSDMVMGTNPTNGKNYYYIDNHIENTRYICLSTGRMWTYVDEVIWCVEALNSTPQNWHIVIIGHLWLNNDYDNGGIITTPENYIQSYLDMFDAYNYREKGTTSVNAVTYDFTDAKAKIEFIIGGHAHQDYDFSTTKGIPVILTECDARIERDNMSVATQGTITENCVYAIIADYTTKAVKVINIGRGDMRTIVIPNVVVVTYTNWLPKATNPDGSIYNDIGYKSSTRLSISSGNFEEKTEAGWCTSGLIPAKDGDVVRLKNCVFTKSTTAATHRGGVYFAKSDGSYAGEMVSMSIVDSNLNPVYDTDGDNIIQFTIPTWADCDSIRIVVQEFTTDSIITVNEEISESNVPDVPVVSYTNVLPTAINFDGTVLNANTTSGYAANSRYSTSSNKMSSLTGTFVTGLIPCANDATIRMKNISTENANVYDAVWIFNMNDTDGNGVYYNDKYTFEYMIEKPDAFHCVTNESGAIIEFTLPGWQANQTHIAIGSQYIGSDSIITINEPID